MPGVAKGTVSRRQQVADAVLAYTQTHGVAAHQRDIEAVLAAAHGGTVRFAVASVISQLCTSGVLVFVHGRPPHGRYAHRSHRIDAVPSNDPMAAAVAAVEALWATTGAEAGTAAVTDAMRARGVVLKDPRNYRLLLTALANPSSKGATAWRAPKLAMRTVTAADGNPRTLWRPAGTPVPVERAPANHVDAVLEAVRIAERALGRPMSRAELALWVATHHDHAPAAAYLHRTGTLGRALEQLSARRAAARVRGRGTWRVVTTPATVPGGPPERYTLQPVAPIVLAALQLEDALRTLRPAQEREALVAARPLVARLRVPALDALVTQRAALLAARLRPAIDEGTLSARVGILRHATETLRAWTARIPVNARSAKAQPVQALIDQLDALVALPVGQSDIAVTLGRVVGEAATASAAELDPYAAAAYGALGEPAANETTRRSLYASARRFRDPDARWAQNPATGALIPPERRGLGWLRVDRVDALLACWDAVAPPRATALLQPARVLLGHVVRDAAPLHAALGTVPPTNGEARRALVLALALLGECVALDTAVPDRRDDLDTAAYLLACALCTPDVARLGATARHVQASATSVGAQRVAAEADRHLSSGGLITLIG